MNKDIAIYINEVPMPSPTIDGIELLKEMIYQEEGTGRNQKGEMIRTEIGVANKVTLTWKHITKEQYGIIYSVLRMSKDTNLYIPNDLLGNPGQTNTHTKIVSYYSSITPKKINTTSGAYYSMTVEFIPLKLERGW